MPIELWLKLSKLWRWMENVGLGFWAAAVWITRRLEREMSLAMGRHCVRGFLPDRRRSP